MTKIPSPRNPDPKNCQHKSVTYSKWIWSNELNRYYRTVHCANPKCKKYLRNETKKSGS